jgi:hypothetical protein
MRDRYHAGHEWVRAFLLRNRAPVLTLAIGWAVIVIAVWLGLFYTVATTDTPPSAEAGTPVHAAPGGPTAVPTVAPVPVAGPADSGASEGHTAAPSHRVIRDPKPTVSHAPRKIHPHPHPHPKAHKHKPKPKPKPHKSKPKPPAGIYYQNCSVVPEYLKPLHRGEQGYRLGLDGDDDGWACEP